MSLVAEALYPSGEESYRLPNKMKGVEKLTLLFSMRTGRLWSLPRRKRNGQQVVYE